MTATTSNNPKRDSERYATGDGVTIRGSLWSDSVDCDCEIMDLTPEGCCIRIPIKQLPGSRFPNLPMVLIRVQEPSLEIYIQSLGHIRWSRQSTMDSWSLGIKFHKPLHPAMLDNLVKSGTIDRRCSQRNAILVPVTVRRKFGEDAIQKANIHERSPSGIRLWTDIELKPCEQIVLELSDGKISMCSVIWSTTCHEGFESGCSIANASSARAIMQAPTN